MFLLKKFVAFWLMPLPVCLVILAIGWAFTFSRARRRLGRWLIGTGIVLLLLLSNKAFSTWLVRPLETAFAPLPEFAPGTPLPPDLAACRFVVVLGGGHSDAPGLAAVNQLSASALARTTEAIRLLGVLPEARLIVSGPGTPGRPTHATVLMQAAVSLGVPPDRVIRIDTARDTEDEAREIHRIVGSGGFVLVTSAWHMPRAMALMQGAGMAPIPSPCDFSVRPAAAPTFHDYTWDTESLTRSTRAVHERLGQLWVRLRGKT